MAQDKSHDGWINRAELLGLTHLSPVWRWCQSKQGRERWVNGKLVDSAVSKMPYRPNPFSTLADYTSWKSLTDRVYSGRHFGPGSIAGDPLPTADEVAKLFLRDEGEDTKESVKSTVLFSYFAQWFTDGFLRSERPPNLAEWNPLDPPEDPPWEDDPAKNDSTHEIDLMQIYGLNERVTDELRVHEGGRLESQMINGEEYPPYLFDESGKKKSEFSKVTLIPTKAFQHTEYR